MSKNNTLLLVDDEPGILKHLAIHLAKQDYTIRTAPSAAAALTILEQEEIDLLLSDIRLPKMNGLELLARAKERQPTLQCILITGHGDIETAVEAMRLGAINYLLKPMNMAELEIAIANGLEKKRLLEEIRKQKEELLQNNRQLQEEIAVRTRAEAQLRQAHAELEQRVATRTAALDKSNRDLKAEILARIQAEKEAEDQAQQLIQADKLVALGTLVSSIGHEISNPNNFILLNIPLIKNSWEGIGHILEKHFQTHGDFEVGRLPYSELRTMMPVTINDLYNGAQRIKKIIAELRNYARPAPSQSQESEVQINEVVESATSLLRHFLQLRTSAFHLDCGSDLPTFRANPQRIEQVVINLLRNAGEALTDRRQGISLRTSFNREQQTITVEVSDSGIGIDPLALTKLAHPFYSTKHESGGLGLGLSICTRIVQSYGGNLTFTSTPGQGTVVTAQFPVATTAPHGAYR